MQYRTANAAVASRTNEWSFRQPIQGRVELDVEFRRQARLLFFIPIQGFRHIALGSPANIDAIAQGKRCRSLSRASDQGL